MITAIKICLYSNAKQEKSLTKAFGCARWFWNNSLAESGKGLGQFALNKRLLELKKKYEWLAQTHCQVLQSVSLHRSRAFVNFCERSAKFPTVKSRQGKPSIQYPPGVELVDGCKIFLPKIEPVKAVVHRRIVGVIKTVSHNQAGPCFASVLTEHNVVLPEISFDGKITGVDVGLTHRVVTSAGLMFDNPHHLAKALNNLKWMQLSLSHKVNGSNTPNKVSIIVAKAHEQVANACKDWLHTLSDRFVDENQVIAVVNLNINGMMKNHCLTKAIGGIGWKMFTEFLKYKAAREGQGRKHSVLPGVVYVGSPCL